ncbi:MAG: DUF2189 domain-containing protein [bacterium]|nr:DUF2189 domain-containing protein [bacterium]
MSEINVETSVTNKNKKEIININKIDYSDVIDSLGEGIRDFRSVPKYGVAIGGIYGLGGWFLYALLNFFQLPYLFYPLLAGFALIAPFLAAGFYDVSRRRERGEGVSWGDVLSAMRLCCGKDLAWMAVVTVFSLIVWVDFAVFIYLMFFGLHAITLPALIETILTTPAGALFFVIGNFFGAVFALTVFSLTVVSFPLLYDRDVDFVTAMVTSVNSVLKNPKAMLLWLFIIGMSFIVSFLTLLVGLFFTLPILGHATWHLYRKLIPDA